MNEKAPSAHPIKGVIFMLFAGLSFVGVYIFVKYGGQRLPAAQLAWIRYALGLVFLLPFVHHFYTEGVSKKTLKLSALRGAVHTVAVTSWFFAIAQIPVAEVTAIGYLTPVFITICALLFLGETFALRRSTAILVAIIGVLIILRPGFREISEGHLAMIATTICFGLSYTIAKKLTHVASNNMVVALLSIMTTIGLTPWAIAVWIPPTLTEVGLMFIVAAFATLGHYFMTAAFRAAPITVTQPVTFLQLLWSVLLGYLLFGESIDGFVIAGGLLIITAVLYITLHEARLQKKRRSLHYD